jgi:predicted esterase
VNVERTIATIIHGRYLVDPAEGGGPHPLLVGFHGYGEEAQVQLDRLRAVRGSALWSLASVQGLHRFYRKGGEVMAASWMTRENRDLMIADNIAYVNAVIDAIVRECHQLTSIVYAGFSQGASMAYRAAVLGDRPPAGVIALGGDIPPDVSADALSRIPRVLVGRGADDRFYTRETNSADVRRLEGAGVHLTTIEPAGGHEWGEPFTRTASDWIRMIS